MSQERTVEICVKLHLMCTIWKTIKIEIFFFYILKNIRICRQNGNTIIHLNYRYFGIDTPHSSYINKRKILLTLIF